MESIFKEPRKMGAKRTRPLRVQRTTLIDIPETLRMEEYLKGKVFEGVSMADVMNEALKQYFDKLKVPYPKVDQTRLGVEI